MKWLPFWIVTLGLGFSAQLPPCVAETGGNVRPPAVAGLFYPADPAVLRRTIDAYLARANTESRGQLKALIVPHAGYSYSGPVAASGFRLLRGTHYSTVIILGPAHYAALDSASVSDAEAYRTPLGDVPVSSQARRLARLSPFALEPPCAVERPDWAARTGVPPPGEGGDRADTWEHADEVELPFLQATLPRFDLVPVVMGDADPARAARALATILDDNTLLVVSSDLSHYHSYAEAQRLDRRCVDAILALDPRRMEEQEACGRLPIITLLHLARQRGWRPQLLDLRNSGDTAGDKSRVVGYAAVAFYAAAAESGLNAADRRFLLQLAREAVAAAASTGGLPPLSAQGLGATLLAPRGVFVTLTSRGRLRGCIGHINPIEPLYRAVAENARSAALRDPRFPPVSVREVDQLEIEISVLTVPQALAFRSPEDLLAQLRPGKDGVVLQTSAGLATYLPQVWEQLPDKVDFMNQLAEKAGGEPDDWRRPGTTVAVYHVESFREPAR